VTNQKIGGGGYYSLNANVKLFCAVNNAYPKTLLNDYLLTSSD